MNPNSQNPAVPSASPAPSQHAPPRRGWLKAGLGVGLCAVAALIGYSTYVSVHEPDRQETLLLGQTKWVAGSPAGLRILVRERGSNKPVPDALVSLSLRPAADVPAQTPPPRPKKQRHGGKIQTENTLSGFTFTAGEHGSIKLGRFHTDASGTCSDEILLPEIAAGNYLLLVEAASPLGRDRIVRTVEVGRPAHVFLSSDKPLYQPGQTIHLRSLVTQARTQRPLTNEPVTFEVTDAKDNKVFKATRPVSAFGIASADFALASELNPGRYVLHATAGAASAAQTVEVAHYILPKFKIQLATGQSYYLPGQVVSGTVQATYVFGQPVQGANVLVRAHTSESNSTSLAEVSGQTDAAGKYAFHFVLPEALGGEPQAPAEPRVELSAQVEDTARHAEQAQLSLPVAKDELQVVAIPEAGTWVCGVENLLYVLTTYPDGQPAVCRVFANGTPYQSDAQGVSIVRLLPSAANSYLELQVLDASGRKTKQIWRPEASMAPPSLLLRTDKAIYRAGQTARLTVLSPGADGTLYIDVLKENQTVLAKSLPLKNHQAEYMLSLPATLSGTLKLNAYLINHAGEDEGCSRFIYINPASSLQIQMQTAQPVFRPGEVARLDFRVTDAAGRPTPAALGISAVDESVFALTESHSGLLQQCLDTERESLTPRYPLKSFGSPVLWLSAPEQYQALAQAFFASLVLPSTEADLQELVKRQYLSERGLEFARSMRGTPAYEALRRNPEYAEAWRLLEGQTGTYSLREATGPAKVQETEAWRQAYFQRLTRLLQVGFLGGLFLVPLLILRRQSWFGMKCQPGKFATAQQTEFVARATACRNVIGTLILCPIVFYPLGGILLGNTLGDRGLGYGLLGFETAVVLLSLLALFARLGNAAALGLAAETVPLRKYLLLFLGQFLVSRAGFLSFALSQGFDSGEFVLLWALASLVAPLVILGALESHLRRQLTLHQVPEPHPGCRLGEVLLVLSIILVLSAMLLPALSKAKSRAQRVSLANELRQIVKANQMAREDEAPGAQAPAAAPARVRREFPETLFWRPELITDDQGRASLEIPLADSITTWRASVDAISAAGQLGSVQTPLRVFQPFFVDLDLPAALTLDDQVSVPVTGYNYLHEPQDIRLRLSPANWFESSAPETTLHLEPGAVTRALLPIKVLRVGTHALRVTAEGAKLADAVERAVRVVPSGQPIEHTCNDSLKDSATDTFTVPADAIPNSAGLVAKFYPSRFTEILEGLESVFQAPHGCFEQTSSTTYPNVLVLDYLQRVRRLTPQAEGRARQFINEGYQRLLTFEVPGGGFEWFGHSPAHVGLTACGILEFTDMSRVHPVDAAVLDRTTRWLYSQQQADGSWQWSGGLDSFSGHGPVTAYVAWALAESGARSVHLERALSYLRTHPEELASTYQEALAANAFLAWDRNDAFGRRLAAHLLAVAVPSPRNLLHWKSTGQSMTYSRGADMEVETTALSALALMKTGSSSQAVKQALTWLSAAKLSDGTWGSTQATILAMRALLAGSSASLGQDFVSTITVSVNGRTIETFRIDRQNSDVMKQVSLTPYLQAGENRVELHQSPSGDLPFQLAGAYWLPTRPAPSDVSASRQAVSEPLQIQAHYDRTTVSANEPVKCAVTIENGATQTLNMPVVQVAIPPGFEVDAGAFDALQASGRIARYELSPGTVVLYLRELAGRVPFRFEYSLQAHHPLRVQAPPATVFEYYQPQNRAQTQPVTLQVVNGR